MTQVRTGDALLLIEVISNLNFPGGEKVLPWALKQAPLLAAFRDKARQSGIPIIYANDNFGMWHASLSDVYKHCTRRGSRGAKAVRRLKPRREDFSILKPRHSAFYATPLVPLLEDLKVKRLILAGIATNLCVLFTAHDAHMRGYQQIVLSDCCSAESDFDHDVALSQLKRFCKAQICLSTEIHFKRARR